MIELSSALIRQFRAVLRKSVVAADRQGPAPLAVCRTGRQGLLLSCQQVDVAVAYHCPGTFQKASVTLPMSVLVDLERAGQVITVEQTAPFKAKATWGSGEASGVLEFDTADPDSLPPVPEPARNSVSLDPGFLEALDEAARTASREGARYALQQMLLRGRDGAVIATDGKQLLLQKGFAFPWKEDRFVPALPVFGCRELPGDQAVKVGCTEQHVTLEVGPWRFAFKRVPEVRYPDVSMAIPRSRDVRTRLILHPDDRTLLAKELPNLPSNDEQFRPITLDLGSKISVRARDKDGIGEVVLAHSQKEGPPVQMVMDRRYLMRAAKLGFQEVQIIDADKPLLCQDDRRTYVWMTLNDGEAVQAAMPSQEVTISPKRGAATAPPEPSERSIPMPVNDNPNNGQQRNGSAHPSEEPLDPLAEADELRSMLQAALMRTSRLIGALKHQRRENRAVQAAMESLRRLRPLDR